MPSPASILSPTERVSSPFLSTSTPTSTEPDTLRHSTLTCTCSNSQIPLRALTNSLQSIPPLPAFFNSLSQSDLCNFPPFPSLVSSAMIQHRHLGSTHLPMRLGDLVVSTPTTTVATPTSMSPAISPTKSSPFKATSGSMSPISNNQDGLDDSAQPSISQSVIPSSSFQSMSSTMASQRPSSPLSQCSGASTTLTAVTATTTTRTTAMTTDSGSTRSTAVSTAATASSKLGKSSSLSVPRFNSKSLWLLNQHRRSHSEASPMSNLCATTMMTTRTTTAAAATTATATSAVTPSPTFHSPQTLSCINPAALILMNRRRSSSVNTVSFSSATNATSNIIPPFVDFSQSPMDSSPSSVDNVVMESPRRRLELESVRARFEQGLAVVDDAESIHDEMTVGNALEAGTNENSSMQSFFEEQLVVGITSSPSPVLSPSCSTAKSSSVITMFGSAPASPSPPPPPPLLPLPTPFGSYTFGAEPVLASSSTKSLFPQEFLMPNGAFYRFDGTSLVPSSSSFMLHLQQATESMIESIPASGFMGSSALEGSVPAPGPQYLHPSALTLNSSLSAPMDAVSDTAMTIGSTLSTMFPRPGFAPPVFDFSSYIPLINSRGDGYNQSVQGSDNSHLGQHVRGDDDNNISSSSSSSVSSPGGSFIYDSRFYSTASGSLEESFSPLSTRVKNAKNRIQKRVLPRRTACKGTLTLRKTATHAFQGSLMTCSASRRPSVDSTYSSSSSSITNLNTSCFPNNFFMDSAAATGMAFANTNDPSSDGFLIASSSKDGTLEDAEEEAHVDKRDPSLRYRKNGAGKFACPFDGCNYRFNLNRELTRHRNVHLFAGKSRYQCANCETGLCRLDSVKRHMEAKGKKACLMNGLYKEFCEEGGLIATYACKESWYLAAEAAAAARRQNERTRARI